MRNFILGGQLFDVRDNQLTSDEKQALVDEAQANIDSLEEGEEGYSEALLALESLSNVIACAPSGAVDVTDCAEDIKTYSVTHTPSLVDGALVWTEKVVELTVQQQIDALESSISARRWREAYLGDEEAKVFIEDINSQIEELREQL